MSKTKEKKKAAPKGNSVTSHTVQLPGDGVQVFAEGEGSEDTIATLIQSETEEKDEKIVKGSKNDPMMIGYVFPGNSVGTPYDYLNLERKPGEKEFYRKGPGANDQRVFGVRLMDLREGIEGVPIPPLAIWETGQWWGAFRQQDLPFKPASEAEEELLGDLAWVVDGQGTPGAYLFNVYILPWELGTNWDPPKHPLLWLKSQKDGKAVSHYVQESKGSSWRTAPAAAAAKAAPVVAVPPPKTSAPSLPLGVRFRCPDCGHWFKENDLKAHPLCCPGGENTIDGQTSDWAVMCDKECGCEVHFGAMLGDKTLDHVGQCKPGFPRPKAEKKKEEVKALSAVEDEPQEETPADAPNEEAPEAEDAPEAETAEANDA